MHDLFNLHFFGGEPHILDIDLAAVLGMRRPTDIRTGAIKALRDHLWYCGYLYRDGKAVYLSERQCYVILRFSTSRRADRTSVLVTETFSRYRRETLPRMGVMDVLRLGIQLPSQELEPGQRMALDAIRSKVLQTARRKQANVAARRRSHRKRNFTNS